MKSKLRRMVKEMNVILKVFKNVIYHFINLIYEIFLCFIICISFILYLLYYFLNPKERLKVKLLMEEECLKNDHNVR